MPEQWELEQRQYEEEQERQRVAREQQVERERVGREEAKEREQREREDRERKEGEARETRERERQERGERETREREEASTRRDEQREAREAAERTHQQTLSAAERATAPRPAASYTGSGASSFLLSLTSLAGQTPTRYTPPPGTLTGQGTFKMFAENENVMGDRTVLPGTQWAIYGVYLKVIGIARAFINEAKAPENGSGVMNAIFTLSRGVIPIWIASGSAAIKNIIKVGALEQVEGTGPLVLSAEFTNPVIMGPGEQLTLVGEYESSMAWTNAEAHVEGITFAAAGSGVIRYDIEDRPQGGIQYE